MSERNAVLFCNLQRFVSLHYADVSKDGLPPVDIVVVGAVIHDGEDRMLIVLADERGRWTNVLDGMPVTDSVTKWWPLPALYPLPRQEQACYNPA